MLGYDYQVEMTGDTQLTINFDFENAEHVSAFQPEDEVEITLYGPFFDK